MADNNYLETLNHYIDDMRESFVTLDQTIDALDSFIEVLRAKRDAQSDKLASLLKERAEYLCPFKVGDYIKGWDYYNKDKVAKVIGIYDRTSAPLWNVMIEKDGAPYTLHFIDANRLSLADVDAE